MAIIDAECPTETCVAYRPIFIYGEDDGAGGICQVMYCDVYFDQVYYKTVTSYSPWLILGPLLTMTIFRFDIQALAQEYIKTLEYDVTGMTFADVYHNPASGAGVKNGMVTCTCYIRGSSVDIYGTITPEGPVPVQGTVDNPPRGGGGAVCTPFVFNILNATLQATDMQIAEQQLTAARKTAYQYPIDVASRTYPLSYANKIKVHLNDWGVLPYYHEDITGSSSASVYWRVTFRDLTDTVTIWSDYSAAMTQHEACMYTVPYGLMNLHAYFASVGRPIPPAIPLLCSHYYISVHRLSPDTPLMFSPKIYVEKNEGVMPAYSPVYNADNPGAQLVLKHTRIWFQNYLGQLEALNLTEREETLKVTSTPTEQTLTEGGVSNTNFLFYRSGGRNNVRSNEFSAATGLFNEDDMLVVKQLLGTSRAYVEFTSPQSVGGGVSPAVKLMPVVLIDDSIDTLVWDDRYQYRIGIKYRLSNENILIR